MEEVRWEVEKFSDQTGIQGGHGKAMGELQGPGS